MAILKTFFRLFASRNYIDVTSLAYQKPFSRKTIALKPLPKRKTTIKKFKITPLKPPLLDAKLTAKPLISKTQATITKTQALRVFKKEAVIAGEVTHFFPKIQVCVIRAKKTVSLGDTLHFKGPSTDFTQTIQSMQINHAQVKQAKINEEFGLKLNKPVRVSDICLFA